MISQPDALASWEPFLRLFPDADLVAALAPLAQRLDAALGPMRTRDRVDEGDPDGFSDIGRRGPYERLLLSEWLLADEAPDEFLRRAAMGEHGFLQLARRTRTGGRISFALFDAGPSQIGGPRIAHLALLIVLARRAEAAKARFRWAILQKPDQEATVGLTESSIRALLLARTSAAPTAEMWDKWRARAAAQSDVDDFWAIGGERLARFAAHDGAASVLVRDELGLETSEISAHVHRPGRADSHVQLLLPPDAICARLLRDPFAAAVATPTQARPNMAPASNLLFTPSGGKLIARAQGGGLIAYPVPNSPRSGPGYPKIYQHPARQRILAAGRIGKAYVIVTRPATDALLVYCLGGKNGNVAAGGYPLDAKYQGTIDTISDAPLLPCFAEPHANPEGSRLIIALPRNSAGPRRLSIAHLHRDGKGAAYVSQRYSNGVFLAARGARDRIIYGLEVTNGWSVAIVGSERTPHEITGRPDAQSQGLFEGYGADLVDARSVLIAAHVGDEEWTALTRNGMIALRSWPDFRVVGVIAQHDNPLPALVLLEPGARRLRVQGPNQSHALPITNAPIEHVTVSHTAPTIAYSTTDGEVFIYSLEHQAVLYQLTPNGSAS
jgi:hypothetical protein